VNLKRLIKLPKILQTNVVSNKYSSQHFASKTNLVPQRLRPVRECVCVPSGRKISLPTKTDIY